MMNEIRNAFLEQGLDPGLEVKLDGKIHRFRIAANDAKLSGWYVGYQNHTRKSAEKFDVVVFGNFRTLETHTYQSGNVTLSADDKRAVREQIAKAKRTEEELREKIQREVSKEITESWTTLLAEGSSQYLVKKGIADVEGLGIKFDKEGNLYVPLRDLDGQLWSWQRIEWDGTKRLHPGGRKRGCVHIIGNVEKSEVVRICEGFATGASIFAATGEAVVVAFDSGNIVDVAGAFKKVHAGKSIVVCGDDDQWTTKPGSGEPWNPGREKAEEAAKRSLGRAVFPVFESLDGKPTDFNDLHQREGLDAVKEQLIAVEPAEKLALYALGYSDGTYFFTSTRNRQLVAVSAFTEDSFLKLMPLEYWEAVFPGRTEVSRVDWTTAKSQLMEQCRARGIFDSGSVRGSGVWMDAGRIVVNMGDYLVVDGVRVELGSIKSRYFYTLAKRLEPLRTNPLSANECAALIGACNGFKWSKPKDAGVLLAGVLVLSRVCGALPIRPHCWVTGGAQTGKTTLLEGLIHKIMGHNKLYFLGSTSEAGVRQNIKSDAVPVLFDEFETNGPESASKIAACIELMRASWAASGGVIAKGGSNGVSTQYQVKFSAIVSSIRTKLTNDADKGRFTVLELAPHGSDQEHWKRLSGYLAQIDEDYAERLFARVVKLLPVLLQNYKLIKVALAKRADSRFGDQYGMILAGYSILLQDGVIDASDAEFLADNVELDEEKEVAKQADHDDALTQLLTTKVNFEGASSRREMLIGDLIQSQIEQATRAASSAVGGLVIDPAEKNALLTLGIRVDSDSVAITAANHAELESKVWRSTKWSQIWGNSLARLAGAKRQAVRISGHSTKCVVIPIAFFKAETDNL